ncbi:hypothetical protein EVAR_3794_1 [Eumeta japonica]|uniref:Uncharacterized protein n=1 Tax=Eumeta variegata TaxID=151549 RepID=A0A4C1SU92_EUMVA|nr:hypothetical protein EVAR_3794_1 [Eumeta japonica]
MAVTANGAVGDKKKSVALNHPLKTERVVAASACDVMSPQATEKSWPALSRSPRRFAFTALLPLSCSTVVDHYRTTTFVVSGAALNIVGNGCAHGYPAVLFAQLSGNSTALRLTQDDMSWIGI